jgi:hypothetical protein
MLADGIRGKKMAKRYEIGIGFEIEVEGNFALNGEKAWELVQGIIDTGAKSSPFGETVLEILIKDGQIRPLEPHRKDDTSTV